MTARPALRLLRHATLLVRLDGRTLLVDPMLGAAGSADPIPNTPNQRPNPLVEMPEFDPSVVDAVAVTHTHDDHLDDAAAEALPADLPTFCQPADADGIAGMGFSDVRPVGESADWDGLELVRTGGRHGTGDLADRMGPVSGFVLRADDAPTVHVAGDTVPCPELEAALDEHEPDVVVANAGAAQFLEGDPITMTAGDVAWLCRQVPGATVVADHMEAINHCLLSRADLRDALAADGLADRVRIPADGEWVDLADPET